MSMRFEDPAADFIPAVERVFGTSPRVLAQPGIALHDPFPLTGLEALPVERAILDALGR